MTISETDCLTGYVLHTRKFQETSLLVEFFSRDEGRGSLLFKGIRRQQKKQLSSRAELHLFRKLSVQRVSRGELAVAKVIESLGDYVPLVGQAAVVGLYVNELIYRLVGRFEGQTALFDAYDRLIQTLRVTPLDLKALRIFELAMLAELGFGIDFRFDARRQTTIKMAEQYDFFPEQGFRSLARPEDSGFSGADLIALGDGIMSDQGAKIVKLVVRQVVHHLLGGRPLKARDLLESPQS
jgi:DNA repair protein RecO (recombination protein O)